MTKRYISVLQALLGLAFVSMLLAPAPSQAAQVTCESRNSQRAECPIDTRGDVRLVRQLSKTRCEEGRNWGAGRGVVWVQSGCRATFESTRTGGGSVAGSQVTCESRGNGYAECALNSRGRVALVRQLSDTACVKNRNWGAERTHVWVSGGCRAVFQAARGVGPGGNPGSGAGGTSQVTCESKNNRQSECRMDTRNGVRLVRQLSQSSCIEGRSWGVARDYVWVRSGCRGVFASERGNAGGGNLPQQAVCASRNNRRNECPLDTRYGVRYQQRLGDAPCEEGRSWGAGNGFVWVDRGCHGRFAAGVEGGATAEPRVATCESRNNRYQECPLYTRGGVRLVRRLSNTRCEEGQSWGVNWNSVWVDRGCRAEFASSWDGQPGQLPLPPGGGQVTCESRNNRYHQCAMDTRDGVRLVRRLSDARCEEGNSWGVTRDAVWVDRGCRAVFETGRR